MNDRQLSIILENIAEELTIHIDNLQSELLDTSLEREKRYEYIGNKPLPMFYDASVRAKANPDEWRVIEDGEFLVLEDLFALRNRLRRQAEILRTNCEEA